MQEFFTEAESKILRKAGMLPYEECDKNLRMGFTGCDKSAYLISLKYGVVIAEIYNGSAKIDFYPNHDFVVATDSGWTMALGEFKVLKKYLRILDQILTSMCLSISATLRSNSTLSDEEKHSLVSDNIVKLVFRKYGIEDKSRSVFML